MINIGAVMRYVDDFDTALETRDWGTHFVLSGPEGNRLQVCQFAG